MSTLPSNLEEAFNYGLFSPPFNGKAGKFLDDERTLAQYPLPGGPVGYLEMKYKRRVYKMNVDEKTLRALHAKSSRRKFLDCVQSGNVEKVTKFCDRGLDPNFHADASLFTSTTGWSGNENETPLTLAVQLKQPNPILCALVHGGAHLDFRARTDGCTALHRAAQRNNFNALTALLELGASPDYRDAKGLTPLYYAVILASDAHLCERLLHEYASIGGSNDSHGWQEVHQACRLGRVKHLEHLIFYGGDEVLNARNINGNTPLHIAAASNQESCVRYLLFRGADKSALNCAKQNCQQVSILAGNYELAEIIAKHSADDIVKHCERPSFNPRRRGGRRLVNGKPAPAPPSQQNSEQNGLYANHCDVASNLSASNKSQQPIVTARDLPRSVSDINGWVASTAKRSSRRREQLQKQQQNQRTHSAGLDDGKPRGTTAASSGVVADGSHSSPTRSVIGSDLADSCNEEEICDNESLSTPSTASRQNHNHRRQHRVLVHSSSNLQKINNANPYGCDESLSSFESNGCVNNKPQSASISVNKTQNEPKMNKLGQSSPNSGGGGGEDTSGVVTDKSSCNSDSPQPHLVNNVVVPSNAPAGPQQAKIYGHAPKNSISSSSSSSGIAIRQHESGPNENPSRFNTSARPSIGSTHTIVAAPHGYGTPNSGDTLRPAAAVQYATQQSQRDTTVHERARVVQVRRGPHGFGFVLRGSRSGTGMPQQSLAGGESAIEPPALQYLDEVDDGGPGDLAGLRPGDFLLAINNEDVRAYPHERCVNMIRQCKDVVELTVVTMADPSAFPPPNSSAVRLSSQRSVSGSVLASSINRTASHSSVVAFKQNLARKTAPAPPRRSPHTSLSTNGDHQSTTDLDDSISTSDSAFLPSSQNHYETSDQVLLHHSVSMPNATLARSNNQNQSLTGARHSSSSSSATNNNKQFSSVSQMKRAREKQRRRAAAAVMHNNAEIAAAHQRQPSDGGGTPHFYTAADDDEIDYYYQHMMGDEQSQKSQQHRAHRFAANGPTNGAPAMSRSKSESRSSHQKRRSKNKTAAGEDDSIYYQPHPQHPPNDYDDQSSGSYQPTHQYYHHNVSTMPHSHTFQNVESANYGRHAPFSSSYQPQPVVPLSLRQNSYNSRTLGHHQQQQRPHPAALSHQHSTPQQQPQQHVSGRTMRRTPYSQPDFVASSNHHNGKSHYRPKLDPITGSPMPPTLLSISAAAEHEEPMPDYFEDDDEDEHHENNPHNRENIPPYYSPASSSARSSQQPSNVSDLSFPMESDSTTNAAPKSILRSRLPHAPAPPPIPPPGSLQDATSTTDDAATTLSVGSSLQNQQRGSNSAFANAISEAAATLSRKRAETAATGRIQQQRQNKAGDTLMAGIGNITKPMVLISTAASASGSQAAVVKEVDVFQADLKRALERRRNKMQSDSGESCAK